MSGDSGEDLAAFVALHGAALRASCVPARYWESLRRKLRGEVGRGSSQSSRRPSGSGPAEGAEAAAAVAGSGGEPRHAARAAAPISAPARGAGGGWHQACDGSRRGRV